MLRAEYGRGIAGAMQDTDDDQRGFRCAVVDDIAAVNGGSQTGRKDIPARSKLGMLTQGCEFLFGPPDKPVRRLNRAFGDQGPDFGEVVFGLSGYLQDERADRFCFPFSIIRSGSKSLTRFAGISSRPA